MENTKLRLWAKKGRYDDLDNRPQIPLISGSPAPAKKKRDNISTALVDAATLVAKAFQTSHTSTTEAGLQRSSNSIPVPTPSCKHRFVLPAIGQTYIHA